MQFALVNRLRTKAGPGLAGICPSCNAPMIAKCGDLRAWHWSHRATLRCDSWWEPETDWHINWKNRFPAEWQEVVRHADDGERHIADVRTADGRVIEFQHSRISSEERQSRELFYKSMVWVIDGRARKRDLQSFDATRQLVRASPPYYSGFTSECALLRDWVCRPVDVFLDFGVREEDFKSFRRPILWHLHPNSAGQVILTPILVAAFVQALHEGKPFARIHVKPPRRLVLSLPMPLGLPPPFPGRRRYPESFQQYWSRKQRSQRRF